MTNDVEVYGKAAKLGATRKERLALWEVHGYYPDRTLENGDRIAVAEPYKFGDLDPEEYGAIQERLTKNKSEGRDYRARIGRRYGTTYYAPLTERPGLFLEFSHLVDGGQVTIEQWRTWLQTHGVLGRVPGGQSYRPTRYAGATHVDIYSKFVDEARLANRIRRLFEAATRKQKPDVASIERLMPDWYVEAAPHMYEKIRTDPKQMQSAALQVVRETVLSKVGQGSFRELLERDNFRQKRKSPLVERWGFNSLLGAMWLQFMWVTTRDNTRYCNHCGKVLPPDKRSDADFCNRVCKQAAKRERESA